MLRATLYGRLNLATNWLKCTRQSMRFDAGGCAVLTKTVAVLNTEIAAEVAVRKVLRGHLNTPRLPGLHPR